MDISMINLRYLGDQHIDLLNNGKDRFILSVNDLSGSVSVNACIISGELGLQLIFGATGMLY